LKGEHITKNNRRQPAVLDRFVQHGSVLLNHLRQKYFSRNM